MNIVWEAIKFLLIICTVLGTSFSSSSARWLWVNSEKLPVECQPAQQVFEEQLITRLNELLGESISYDGQLLSCDNDQCAQARLATAGATIALFHKSNCIKESITYELRLNDLNQKTLIYRSSFAINRPIEELGQLGIDLAERVVRGPKVKVKEKQDKSNWRLGVGTGVHTQNIAERDGFGPQLQIELFQELDNPHFNLRYAVSWVSTGSESFEHESTKGEFAVTYVLSPKALSTWFSLGINVSHNLESYKAYARESFNEDRFYLNYHEMSDEEFLDSALWLESGFILTSGSLQPHLSVRVSPFSVSSGFSAELSTLFGLRW